MGPWHDVMASAGLREGARVSVRAGERAVALIRVSGQVYAIDDVCPHHGASLGQGDLQGHHLYCPLHAWCFDVRTGAAFFPKGARVERFEVRERDGRIEVLASPRGETAPG